MSKPKTNKTKKPPVPKAKTTLKKAKCVEDGKPPEEQNVPKPAKESKLDLVVKMLRRPEGAKVDDLVVATGWQKHTVRACISHALAKKRSYKIVSEKPQGGKRTYKIVEPPDDGH